MTQQEYKILINKTYNHVIQIMKEDHLKMFLNLISILYSYSFNNILYVFSETDKVTYLATKEKWEKNKRKLNFEAKPIYIISLYLDESSSYTKKLIYKKTKVYDLDQTNGKYFSTFKLSDYQEIDLYLLFINTIHKMLKNKGFELIFSNKFNALAFGECDYKNKQVFVLDKMNKIDTLTTLIQVATNALIQVEAKSEASRIKKIIEADCISYIVLHTFNYDTSHFSFSYIYPFLMNRNLDIKNILIHIHRASKMFIEEIKKELKKEKKENKKKNLA